MQIVFLMVFDASQTTLIWTSSSDIPECVLHYILQDINKFIVSINELNHPIQCRGFQICLVKGVSSNLTCCLGWESLVDGDKGQLLAH